MPLVAPVRKLASRCLLPLVERASKAYVAGPRLEDALRVADSLADSRLGVTIGYWDNENDLPRAIADEYLAGILALSGREHAYLSIKVPSLGFSEELLGELVEASMTYRVRLHFDALGPETAKRSRALCEKFLDHGAELSYTLPARWARSVDDAAWAADRGISVRVVKGQWADSADPRRDPRLGFLQVIDALAGRARHVAIASHDLPLVAEAVKRLQRTSTSCELELLHGLPLRRSLRQADQLALGVHVYVPYGQAFLPYALSRVRNNPRIVWWLLRDLLTARLARTKTDHHDDELIAR